MRSGSAAAAHEDAEDTRPQILKDAERKNAERAEQQKEMGEGLRLGMRRQLVKNLNAKAGGTGVTVSLRGENEDILDYTKRTWSEYEINSLLEGSAAERYKGYRQAGFIIIRFKNSIGETVKKINL